MIAEYTLVSQVDGESRRRWFGDDYWDLIVWSDDAGEILGFQLCYDKGINEHALTWKRGEGFTHDRVSGADYRERSMSPILVADGFFDRDGIADRFLKDSTVIEHRIREFIHGKVKQYPQG